MKIVRIVMLMLAGALSVLLQPVVQAAAARKCTPTPPDEIGPFYRPNTPLRAKIGSGYLLEGVVRDATTCLPVPGARIEFWQAGPGGTYDDAHRAAIISDANGHYRLETSFPPPYARRPSHIHILADMRGYAGLITQHYPKRGATRAAFDLVMERE